MSCGGDGDVAMQNAGTKSRLNDAWGLGWDAEEVASVAEIQRKEDENKSNKLTSLFF